MDTDMTAAIPLPLFIAPSEWFVEWLAGKLTQMRDFGRAAWVRASLPCLLVVFVWCLALLVWLSRRRLSQNWPADSWRTHLGDFHTIHDGLRSIEEHLSDMRVFLVRAYARRHLAQLREDLGDIIEAIELGLNPEVRKGLLRAAQSVAMVRRRS